MSIFSLVRMNEYQGLTSSPGLTRLCTAQKREPYAPTVHRISSYMSIFRPNNGENISDNAFTSRGWPCIPAFLVFGYTIATWSYCVSSIAYAILPLLPPAKRMVLLSVASVNLCVSVCVSVCLCVCPVRALTFESLDLETSFFGTEIPVHLQNI